MTQAEKCRRLQSLDEENAVKINCLSCGFNLKLDEAYDDYEGQAKCWACGALLEIRTEEGHVRSVRLAQQVHIGVEPGHGREAAESAPRPAPTRARRVSSA